jgi:mRNA interferase RelE/StbE
MKYTIIIEKKAKKFIESQSKDQQKRLMISIHNLPKGDTKVLQGINNLCRLRVGKYRVIYTKQDDTLIIRVIDVENRGQVYKKL